MSRSVSYHESMTRSAITKGLLDSLICGLPSQLRDKWLLAMLTSFVDDSGSDGQGPVFVLGGYVSTVERWKSFTDEWSLALKSGKKQIEYFKMVEANSLKGQFLGWDRTDRNHKLIELAKIIRNNAMFCVQAILWWKHFRIIQREYPAYPLCAYDLLFHSIMVSAVDHIKGLRIQEKIDFIFDDQGLDGDRATHSYRISESQIPAEDLRFVAGPPSHKDEKVFIPLQAADMIAWQTRRFCDENSGKGRRHEEYVFHDTMKILDQIPTVTTNMHIRMLRLFFDTLSRNPPKLS